jgi:hypothetical protein
MHEVICLISTVRFENPLVIIPLFDDILVQAIASFDNSTKSSPIKGHID